MYRITKRTSIANDPTSYCYTLIDCNDKGDGEIIDTLSDYIGRIEDLCEGLNISLEDIIKTYKVLIDRLYINDSMFDDGVKWIDFQPIFNHHLEFKDIEQQILERAKKNDSR